MQFVSNWLGQARSVYFGNAAATRDFRVQLRGSKSAILFGVYLTLLIGVAMIVYTQAVGDMRMSVVEAQAHLSSFYVTVMELLAGAICLIAPALSATTVVLERQRQSLDLVFSAPVTPKYYLVGKILSSYRYVWMLLVLSLPVTAACVVLGGASWSDVLSSYALLSIQALMLTAISLLMSTVAPRPVSAVLWSYVACAPYLALTSSMAAASMQFMNESHGRSLQTPFFIAMSPFTAAFATGTFTQVGLLQVPNWVISVTVTLLLCKITVLCAGALLAPASSKEPISLRIHGLAYLLTFAGIAGYEWAVYGVQNQSVSNTSGSDMGIVFNWVMLPLIAIVPFMTCFGFDGEKRFRPDGVFEWKKMFRPTPATALPYLLTLLLGSALAITAGHMIGVKMILKETDAQLLPGGVFFMYVAFAVSFWSLFWAVGRFASTLGAGLKASRAIVLASYVAICALPVPIFIAIDRSDSLFREGTSIWNLWVLKPLFLAGNFDDRQGQVVTVTAILGLFALAIAFEAERRFKSDFAARKAANQASAPA